MSRSKDQESNRWIRFLIVTALAGLAVGGILGGGSAAENATEGVTLGRITAAFTVAGASLFLGGLIGFVFGIPMFGTPADNGQNGANHSQSLKQNTNLEQVSDWVTKILIGVTLTQFTAIKSAVWEFAGWVGPNFLPGPDATNAQAALASAYILFFLIVGFLFGYLWSRVRLMEVFRELLLTTRLNNLIDKRVEDAALVEEVTDFLTGASALNAEQQTAIANQIEKANELTRKTIFHRARRFRKENQPDWKAGPPALRVSDENSATLAAKSAAMDRVLLVFKALNSAQPDKFHRNYAQIGFAMKDKAEPNHEEAAKAFRTAIRLRTAEKTAFYPNYERGLAECLAWTDLQPGATPKYTDEIKGLIDASGGQGKAALEGWPVLATWLAAQ